MMALVVGVALVIAGLVGLWALHVREREAGRRRPASGATQSLVRYLAFGIGWVCGLAAIVLGCAIVMFAYADLVGR